MAHTNGSTIASEARVIFNRIRESLEVSHANEFVAIEPSSGEFFVGGTLSDAIGAARERYPDRFGARVSGRSQSHDPFWIARSMTGIVE